ncbi:MAG: IclR family transcriptional regulator [Euzebya sp.]
MSSVQSIERAFLLLETLAVSTLGGTELAARTGLPKSTVSRLLGTLESLGCVERPDGTHYRVGPTITALAGAASPVADLMTLARPHLKALVRIIGEDAGLSVPDGDRVYYIDQVSSENAVQVRDWTGSRLPVHAVASGLVMMATWPSDRLESYLSAPLEAFTDQSVTDHDQLCSRLAQVRTEGHAWVHGEFAKGLASVAAPVRDQHGRLVAAIHAHGPAYRYPAPGTQEQIAALVRQAALDLTEQLVHRAALTTNQTVDTLTALS